MKRALAVSVVVLLGVLLLAEVAAHLALPRIPTCAESLRNAFRFRGWPEYLEGMASVSGAARLVLLTNSQGYAGEYPVSKGYPARLEALLNERRVGGRDRWKVMNLAVDGITSIEYMILAAGLQLDPPDVVLAVTGYADYRNDHYRSGFLYCRSDIPRLATRREIARRLPGAYLRRHLKAEDTLTAWMNDRFALPRFREYAWCWMDARFPGLQSVLHAPRVNYHPWEIRAKPAVKPLRLKKGGDEMLDLTYGPGGPVMLREYFDMLRGVRSRVLVVSEPHSLSPQEERARDDAVFQEDVSRCATERGFVFWDLHDALPREDFFDATHFEPPNHERFAAMLADRLATELAQPSTAAP